MTLRSDIGAILHNASGVAVYDVRRPPDAPYPLITLKQVRTKYINSRDKEAYNTKRVRMDAHIWVEADDEDTGSARADVIAEQCENALATADNVAVFMEDRDDYFYTEASRYTVRLQFYAWPE